MNYCKHPWFDVWVNAAGKVTCCPQNKTSFGNLNDISFEEAWNSSEAQYVRNNVKEGNYIEAGCDVECPFLRGNCDHPVDLPPDEELINPIFDVPHEENEYSYNYFNADEHYKKGSLYLDSFPLFIDLQPNLLCNYDCFMCGQPHHDRMVHSIDLTSKLDFLKPYVNYFRWQGGEVFLMKDFTNYLVDFSDPTFSNLRRYVITNGSKLSNSDIDLLTDVENPVRFLVSMDGATEETHFKVRRRKHFKKTFNTMVYLSEKQKLLNRRDLVRWNYVVTKSTLHEIKLAIDLALSLNIDINFAPINGPFEDENIFKYSGLVDFDLMEFFEDLESYSSDLPINVSGFAGIKVRLEHSSN